MSTSNRELLNLNHRIIGCTRCARLIEHCRCVAREKRRMYRDEEYWGKPVPGFGDPRAELLILGLAPAAHGANRTGRMFTGDRSGEFLYRALFEAGFANRPASLHRDDAFRLTNCYITASARCAPPGNKLLPSELRNCQPFLEAEVRLLRHVRAVLALGKVAFDTYLYMVSLTPGFPRKSTLRFVHGAHYKLPGGLPRLFASYHPSQQNTQTGRLTRAMFSTVLESIQRHLKKERCDSLATDC